MKFKKTLIVLYFLVVAILGCVFKFYLMKSKNIYQAGCTLISVESKIIKLVSGYHCLFLDNGDYISSNIENGLQYYDKTGKNIWSEKAFSLHQIKISNDKKSFLTIISETNKINNKLVRSDVFTVRDFNNIPIKNWSTFENLENLKKLNISFFSDCKSPEVCIDKIDWLSFKKLQLDGEITHANSFQEISKKEEVAGSNIWKEGNYLVYLFGPISVALVLDSQLKNILWHYDFRAIDQSDIHDLQIIDGNRLLAYYNTKKIDGISKNFSSLEILDIKSMKSLWSFKASPPDLFFSKTRGGVQLLASGHLLYSISNAQDVSAHEIKPDGTEVLVIKSQIKDGSGKYIEFQEIKEIEAYEFLKNNLL